MDNNKTLMWTVLWIFSVISGGFAGPAGQEYFCSQFYDDIRARSALSLSVPDNADIGAVVRAFRPPALSERRISLVPGPDTTLVDFDHEKFALVVRGNLRARNGETLRLRGQCGDFIYPINVQFNMSTEFLVRVDDVNDPPVLVNLPAVTHIPEDLLPGHSLYSVAVDSSFDINPQFVDYSLKLESITALDGPESVETATAGDYFALSEDGLITLQTPLDYETGPHSFRLVISATDTGSPPLTTTSSLTVRVTDVDDMAPLFDATLYNLEVIGEKPLPGPEACYNTTPAIQAEDQDLHNKSALIYSITQGTPGSREYWSEFFRIDTTTGYLCQKKMIERLVKDGSGIDRFFNFTFTIKASQVDNPRKYDTSSVHVHVLDANEHAPEFDRRLYRGHVTEFPQLKKDTPVVTVKAEDRDYGLNGEFHYELLENPRGIFKINAENGTITVAEPRKVDREKHTNFQFKVRAVESGTLERRSRTARVTVIVEDINDHAPVFDPDEYTYVVKDTLSTGELLHKKGEGIKATDKDHNGNAKLTYTLSDVKQNGGQSTLTDLGRFGVHPTDGSLYLAGSLADLRRKRSYPEYTLVVKATDNAAKIKDRKSAVANVHVRIAEANDHPPRFKLASTRRNRLDGAPPPHTISEDATIGTLVLSMEAEDKDGDKDVFLDYSITKGNELGHFMLKNGGWIIVAKPLDRETVDQYKLTIEVKDGKHSAEAQAHIRVVDVNDNAPRFTSAPFVFPVHEQVGAGSSVAKVSATDPDLGSAGEVSYELEGKHAEMFSVTQDGSIIVENTEVLDAETTDMVLLRLVARDNGTPTLSSTTDVRLMVEDDNDNAPLFSQESYHARVKEGTRRVTMENPIHAHDADKSEANRNVVYTLRESEGSSLFRIQKSTGVISVLSPEKLDSERKALYILQVLATDQGGKGQSSSAKLHIEVEDVNDNPPVFFPHPNLTLEHGMAVGSVIGQIRSHDDDVTAPNNDVIYMLTAGGHGKFSVDFETGHVRVVDELSREPMRREYELYIQAMDLGSPRHTAGTNVTIRAPYNSAPRVVPARQVLRVREDAAPGSRVGRVVARDDDVQDVLEYVQLDKTVPFRLDPRSGLLRTAGHLDAEGITEYFIPISVHDSGLPPLYANGTVVVKVEDVNDNPPSFSHGEYEGEVEEDDTAPLGRQRVTMEEPLLALDADITASQSDIRYDISGVGSEHFSVDRGTGALYISRQGVGHINADTMNEYDLKVKATDAGGLYTEAKVKVKVRDKNDLAPRFSSSSYVFEVGQDAKPGQVIGRVEAKDRDATAPNNRVLYILETDPLGKFKLDPFTGDLSITQGIFHSPQQNIYTLRVSAIDLGEEPNKAVVMVTVRANVPPSPQLNAVHRPEIQGTTIFYVPEEVPTGTIVGKLSTKDDTKDLKFSIKTEKPVPFTISGGGELLTSGRLDSDGGPRSYTFTVRAENGDDPARADTTNIGVIIEDINDNPPVFTQGEYHHMVSDVFPVGTVVATPFAFDNIDTTASLYTYRLELQTIDGERKAVTSDMLPSSSSSPPPPLLDVNEHTGVVAIARDLHAPGVPDARLLEYAIEAVDRGDARLRARARLLVHLVHTADEKEGEGPGCCCVVPCNTTTTATATATATAPPP